MELYNKSIKKKEKINKDVQLIFSQRHSGIEINYKYSAGKNIVSFNRTIVELKYICQTGP